MAIRGVSQVHIEALMSTVVSAHTRGALPQADLGQPRSDDVLCPEYSSACPMSPFFGQAYTANA